MVSDILSGLMNSVNFLDHSGFRPQRRSDAEGYWGAVKPFSFFIFKNKLFFIKPIFWNQCITISPFFYH